MDILTGILAVVVSASEGTWLEAPPLSAKEGGLPAEIAQENIFEVPRSLLDKALFDLNDREIRNLDERSIRYFTNGFMTCKNPDQPYLIRAQYENGGTGIWSVTKFGQNIVVSHESLGSAAEIKKTALVICADVKPLRVFGQTGGAM